MFHWLIFPPGRGQSVTGKIADATHPLWVSYWSGIAAQSRKRPGERQFDKVTTPVHRLGRISRDAVSLATVFLTFYVVAASNLWTASPTECVPFKRIRRRDTPAWWGSNGDKVRWLVCSWWRTLCTHSPLPPDISLTTFSQPTSSCDWLIYSSSPTDSYPPGGLVQTKA